MWVRTDRPPNCGGPSGRTTRRADEKAAPSDTSTWLRRLRDSCVPLASLSFRLVGGTNHTCLNAAVSTSLRDRLDGPDADGAVDAGPAAQAGHARLHARHGRGCEGKLEREIERRGRVAAV